MRTPKFPNHVYLHWEDDMSANSKFLVIETDKADAIENDGPTTIVATYVLQQTQKLRKKVVER
jgi:hypothetical protein